MDDQETVDHLQRAWDSVEQLCATFVPDDWQRPTDLPGWSV